MQEIKKERILSNEFLIVLYFCMFSFLKPLTVSVGGLSKIVLLGATVLVILASLLLNQCRFNINSLGILLVAICFLVGLFAFDLMFRNNAVLLQNLYHLFIYGIVPLFLLMNVKDYERLLKLWCVLTILAGIMFLVDPFIGYRLSGGYMPFGFNHMLPAFISSVTFLLHYRKKWAIIPSAIFFVEMLMYSNKGSVLTAALFCLLFILFLRKQRSKRTIGIVLLITLAVLIIYALRFVLFDLFYDLALQIGIDSYSLKTFRELLYDSPDRIFALRTDIWVLCFDELKHAWAFGIGIGAFEAKYGLYPHNVLFEIAVSFGVLAAVLFAILLVKSIIDFKRYDKNKKIFMFIILMLWLFPMQISLSLWNYAPFWIYWGVYFSSFKLGLRKAEPKVSDTVEEL